jgi:putative membrane protein
MTRPPTIQWRTSALAVIGALALAPGPACAEKSDADFVRHAASDGMLEVKLGAHAAESAQDPAVREFGERMVRDHQAANDELKTVAGQAGLSVPAELEPEHQKKLAELSALTGAELDRRYMDEMVKAHEKDVRAFQEQAEGDSAVDRWAARTVPTLQHHLDLARDIQAQSTRGAAMPPETERTSAP